MKLFKIAKNQTVDVRLKQRFVITFLVAENCKSCEIYRRMCDIYGETCFSKNKYLQKS